MPPWPSRSRSAGGGHDAGAPQADPPRAAAPGELPDDAGPVLLALAREAIGAGPVPARPVAADTGWLAEPGACFVTLHTEGRLHGCIGTIWPRRALGQDVRDNARAAAYRDRRFPPLTRAELDDTVVDVSVLSPTSPVPGRTEDEVLAALRPGIDGVVIECGERRATLLPQVWATLADPREFLAHLRLKAGLPRDFWSDQVSVSRYTVTEFSEQGLR